MDDWRDLVADSSYERAVPSVWTSEHVLVRMIEAFETLNRVPGGLGGGSGGSWPRYVYEWEDLLAQEETREAELRRRKYQEREVRIPPSKAAIDLMDEALGWPGRYLGFNYRGKILVVDWAFRRSRPDDRGSKAPIPLVVKQAEEIARGLRRDRVIVR